MKSLEFIISELMNAIVAILIVYTFYIVQNSKNNINFGTFLIQKFEQGRFDFAPPSQE